MKLPALSHLLGERSFIVISLVKANCETSYAGASLFCQRRRYAAGIQPAAQQHSNGDVTNAAQFDCVIEDLPIPGSRVSRQVFSQSPRFFRQVPPTVNLGPTIPPHQVMSW